MTHRNFKMRRPYTGLLVALGALGMAGLASADVVLHPGTITGTAGLTGADARYGSVYVGGNASGFSGSTSFNGNTFSLTIEGGQTYGYLSASMDFGGSQFWLSSNASIVVPAGGSVALDLTRPSGTIASQVRVTGGTLGTTQLTANASNGSESYGANAQAYGGADASLRFAAASSVSVGGTVSIQVLDADGASLCTTQKRLAPQTVALAADARVNVVQDVTVSAADCGTQLTGLVSLSGLPDSLSPYASYVYASGPTFASQYVEGNNQTYLLQGLAPGDYYAAAYEYFQSSYMQPPGNPSVHIGPGETVTHDYIHDGVVGTGRVTIGGSWAGRPVSGSAYFYSAQGNGWANAWFAANDFTAVLTAGDWSRRNLSLSFYDPSSAVPIQSYAQFYDYNAHAVSMTPGTQGSFGTTDVATSEGQITFDVIEAPGTPVVGISNPAVYASRYDSATSTYVYLNAYGTANNADTPPVRIVGSPGTYQFDAYGTVKGSWTRFASSTLDLGQSVNTPTGQGVVITPKDSTGAATPLTVDFANVSGGGQTTVTISDVGPAVSSDYLVLKAFKNQQTFIDISTTATYSGKIEVCFQYDPVALQLTSQQEAKLVLQHYTCSTPTSCVWENANELFNPHSPAYTDADAHYFGRSGGTAVNTETHTICGVTSSLSPFALTLPVVTQVPPSDACVGASTAPAQLSTSPGTCGVSVDNTNQVAGGCSGGGGGLLSCTYDGARSKVLSLGNQSVSIVGTAVDGSSSSCTSFVTVVDREAPQVSCPPSVRIECTGTTTPYTAVAACGDNCGACTASCGNGPFEVGANAVACNAVDSSNNRSSCSTTVQVVDTVAPTLTVTAAPTRLYPPNHKMVPIALKMPTTDACDALPTVSCTAASNEPVTGGGSGATAYDILWDDGQLFVRSERAGTLNDRVYTVTCTSKDASGNATTATTKVTVPHSQ